MVPFPPPAPAPLFGGLNVVYSSVKQNGLFFKFIFLSEIFPLLEESNE